MQKMNEKRFLTFENIYQENRYRGYQIHDLTEFKSESIDMDMEDIREDILSNINNYLNIESNKSFFMYHQIKTTVEDIFPLGYIIETVNVVFNDHYTYNSYNKDHDLSARIYEDAYSKEMEIIEDACQRLDDNVRQERLDTLENTLHKEIQEFMVNTEDYIADEAMCYLSNYYYTVDVQITLTKAIF